MSEPGLIRRSVDAVRNSVTFKLLVIGFLILVLLIPALMVQELIRERQNRRGEAVNEIASKWGKSQVITGPLLAVPFRRAFTRQDGSKGYNLRTAYFLPKTLEIGGALTPEVRYRGIYQAVLYNARLDIRGRFTRPDFAALDVSEDEIQWDRAFVALGISDMTGIRDAITLDLGEGARLAMNPGIETQDVLGSGVSVRLARAHARRGDITFGLALNLNGSERIRFTPVGEVTQARLASSWKTPSFDGAFLPVTREVGEPGFSAQWKVLHLNRNFPQAWIGERKKLDEAAFGVRLLVAADVYQQATRSAKYAVLFIVLTFTTFFFSEIINRRRLHPVQYLLVGFAVTIFYSLLIALSEHIRFAAAYLSASAAVVVLVGVYAYWSLASTRLAALVAGLLGILYGYLYVLLQLEDYSLLLGSIGLFVALAAVMYVTRKIDWYGEGAANGQS